jgi:hypothetical protein
LTVPAQARWQFPDWNQAEDAAIVKATAARAMEFLRSRESMSCVFTIEFSQFQG